MMKIIETTDRAVYYEFESGDGLSPDHFLNLWGNCELGANCICLKPESEWLGQKCPSWIPAGFRNNDEHLKWFLRKYPKNSS